MSIEAIVDPLQTALEILAPAGCASAVAAIGACPLSDAESSLVESWAPHRQDEFATGRFCARQALSLVGLEAGGMLPDADGLPVWPEGSVGSISHSRGVAMAVVASGQSYSLLGLDLEKTNRMRPAAMRRVVHPMEAAFAGDDQVRVSILFSLKEAFYKAQFPRWRTAGKFQDLALDVDWASGHARVDSMAERFAPELRQLRFTFRLVGDYVISLCWL